MSNFSAEFKNKKTGVTAVIMCLDDYFERHVYGYQLPSGRVLTADEMEQEGWERFSG